MDEDTYSNKSKYTKRIEEIMGKAFPDTGLQYYPEYFKIDYTWWTGSKFSDNGINYYDWKLQAVIEHENTWNDWTYELEKLDSLYAPLKIVIGYLPEDKRSQEKNIIDRQRRLLKNLSNDINCEFGVIILNRKYGTPPDPFDIHCYRLTVTGVDEVIL